MNALKFTDRGSVAVRLRSNAMKNGCALELVVSDTGIGMDEARLEEAFEPFVQLSNSSTREHRGLGLGLTLVRQAALALGAKLEVTSKLATGTESDFRRQCGLRVPPRCLGTDCYGRKLFRKSNEARG